MGNQIKSLNLAEMKAFTSALLAASAVVTLTGTDTTTKVTTTAVIAAAYADGDYTETLGCFLLAANDTRCSYCKFAYSSASNYIATWTAYKWTTTAPTIGAAVAISSVSTNFTTVGTKAQVAIAYGTTSAVVAISETSAWTINAMILGKNAAAMTSSCAATYK